MSKPLSIPVGARYRLEQLLGRGGMGSVYRAYDRLTDQWVALKLVPVGPSFDRTAEGEHSPWGHAETVGLSLNGLVTGVKRALAPTPRPSALAQTVQGEPQALLPGHASRVHVGTEQPGKPTSQLWARMALAQEFRTLAALRHPHIISVLDYGFVKQSQPFFTMELLENAQTLSIASKELPLEQRAQLLVQLLRALSYLHRHGILHRDLKPANVMVRVESGARVVKLLDFGLARARLQLQVRQGELVGTLSYMAPELFEGRAASEATDLFAVGVIAYELFAGRHPFDRGDDALLVSAILGSEPQWEPLQQQVALVALLRRLLAKNPADRPSAEAALMELSAAVGVPLPQETVALRESTLQAARFVGREEPLAILRVAMDAAQSGRGELRLLAGESGVGKSRLMEELRVYSVVQGVISARGQAVSEGGGAYGVWREILRNLCLGTELSDLSASVLKSILPDLEVLLERRIPDAPALHPQAAQLRLVNTIESLILMQTSPLLLLLEDIHWADAESLALLRRLAPQCRTRPLLIVASYRDDERPELPQTLPDCPQLKLTRLSAVSITALCESMLGVEGCTPELVTFLEAETEGNVFFVIEVMRALAEEAGQLSLVASHRLPRSVLTGGIRAIVQRRLARLPTDAWPLLRLAAVQGRQLDLAVLRCFEEDLGPWLYLAADAAVLEVSGSSWRFAHDKIRESLLLELNPSEKQQLHLALARAIEQTYPGSAPWAGVLAEHYQRGGVPAKAAFYLVEAGVHALRQGASIQAATFLAQALTPESRALLSKVQAARANSGLVQATLAIGRFIPCIATYEQFVAAVGRPMPDGLGSLLTSVGAMLARRLRVAPVTTDSSEQAKHHWSQVAHASRWACEAYVWAGQRQKCIVAALLGLEIADSIDDNELKGYFFGMFSHLSGLIPLRTVSNLFYQRGRRLFDGLEHSRVALDFHRISTSRHINAANWELTQSEADTLLALARQLGDENAQMAGLAVLFVMSVRRGDNAAFQSLGPELFQKSRRNHNDQFARAYPMHLGLLALRRGELETAQRYFSEVTAYVQRSQDFVGRVLLGGMTAHCLLLQGKQEETLQRAQELLRIVESAQFSMDALGEGVSGLTEVYLTLWEAGSAVERQQFAEPLRRALAAMRRCGYIFPAFSPRALLWQGRDAWNHGAVRTARYLGAASLRRAEQLGMPYDQALARTWLARFAETLPGETSDWTAETRGLWQILTRSLRSR